MKKCANCGCENEESAPRCVGCGASEFKDQDSTQEGEILKHPRYAIPPLPPEEMGSEWATLLRCRSLAEADFIASEIKGAGLEAMVPDQFMIEAGSFRVQVPPKDYETARTMLNQMSGEEEEV